jgi:hypothetical protein
LLYLIFATILPISTSTPKASAPPAWNPSVKKYSRIVYFLPTISVIRVTRKMKAPGGCTTIYWIYCTAASKNWTRSDFSSAPTGSTWKNIPGGNNGTNLK